MMSEYILDKDRLELLARSDESQFFSGDLVGALAVNVLQLQKRIAELEGQLSVACHVKAVDKVGFDFALLDRIAELDKENYWLKSQHNIDGVRIAELEEASRWIPVGERLPENYERVLLLDYSEIVRIGYKVAGIDQWSTLDGLYFYGDTYCEVTHWRPMPQPPEVE